MREVASRLLLLRLARVLARVARFVVQPLANFKNAFSVCLEAKEYMVKC